MKGLKDYILVILIVIGFNSTAQYDSIFAVVSGDTVTLWQTGAWRNCGAAYRMEIEQSDYNITWYQVDTGSAAFCLCYFDLSVSFQVSEPGTYHANIYYTESIDPGNPVYEGSVYFTIGNSHSPVRSEIIGQYQSNCYQNVGLVERSVSKQFINLYPVPVRDGELFHLEACPGGDKAILEIFTLTGELVYGRHYEGKQLIRDQWMKDELFPVSRIYLARYRTSGQVYIKKITVL